MDWRSRLDEEFVERVVDVFRLRMEQRRKLRDLHDVCHITAACRPIAGVIGFRDEAGKKWNQFTPAEMLVAHLGKLSDLATQS